MPYTGVEESQFEFTEAGVRHKPTGAFFAVDPGQAVPKRVDWARAGEVLENGDYFDRAEIKLIAEILLAQDDPPAS
jgi:hypothetical protein